MAPADGSGGQAEVPAFLQHDEDQLHEASVEPLSYIHHLTFSGIIGI